MHLVGSHMHINALRAATYILLPISLFSCIYLTITLNSTPPKHHPHFSQHNTITQHASSQENVVSLVLTLEPEVCNTYFSLFYSILHSVIDFIVTCPCHSAHNVINQCSFPQPNNPHHQSKITIEYHRPSCESIQEYNNLLADANLHASTATANYKQALSESH